jgi:hypothetical protein
VTFILLIKEENIPDKGEGSETLEFHSKDSTLDK